MFSNANYRCFRGAVIAGAILATAGLVTMATPRPAAAQYAYG